MALIIFY